ncbi:AraC family transcriptional regulator [Burkholderia sp. SJZ115]|uniref:AraC family transcriptional regulator n=2 Tax=Burkholderiaceae TaxID=119060 RepID=UPI00119BA78D|nr:AraC family transcriptional regulator [Burkholderia gladioli]TWC59524.1 AraC family transcriptional regulator [Burkholderia sp. SJZ089]TWC94086.1 AraC family transcriptional regulator [Burkholderia sp. SJZ115]TWC96260.1 AraC family transcriptional regulator [Burkholderia sp. SJZ091]
MDPLSDVLSLLETRSSYFTGLRAGGDWAVDIPPPDGIKFNAVVDGSCWLTVDGAGPPTRLEAGDCFLLAAPRRFVLASDLAVPPVAAIDVYHEMEDGIARYGAPENCFLVGGRFTFKDNMQLLFGSLPPVVIVSGCSEPAAVLRWALQRLAQEIDATSLGASLMVRHLAHMMLVQMLRVHAETNTHGETGWLTALADSRIATGITAIHADPARRWTVEDLAARCHVSRSTFAARFRQRMGFGPLEYVQRWRMQLAMRALRKSDVTVSAVAQSLGYDSDSAFSHAFKRLVGYSPREFRASTKTSSG